MNAICKLCNRFVITTYTTVDSGRLVVGLPAGRYDNGQKFCIVFNQELPSAATVNMPVVFTIGTSQTQYEFTDKCGRPMTASMISTRSKYATHIVTTATSGEFRWEGKCCYANFRQSIGG